MRKALVGTNENGRKTRHFNLHCLFRGEAVDGAPRRDDNESLLVRVVRVDVADGRCHELLWKVAEPTGNVVSCVEQEAKRGDRNNE